MIIRDEFAWGTIALGCIIVLGLAYGLPMALAGLVAVLFAWWAWEYPEESFLTLIALSPLLPMLKVTQTVGNATLIKDVLIIVLFFRTCLIPLLTQKLPYRRNALFAPILALVTWAVFETINAGITTLSLLRLRDIGLYIVLYFGVLYLPHTVKHMKVRYIVFLATLAITAALGIFQFLHLPDSTVLRFDPARSIWIPRVASTFAHPTVFAEYLITGITLCVGVLTTHLFQKHAYKALIMLIALTSIALIYVTYTRAAWIGFAVGITASMLALFLGNRKSISLAAYKKQIALGLGILALALFAAVRFTPVGTFLASAFDPNYASNADRIAFAVNLISKTSNVDAVIGKGLGNVITESYEGGDASVIDITSGESRTVQISKDQTLVDNQYLKTFIEMGVIGIVFTLWLFWRFLIACIHAIQRQDSTSRALGIASIGFLAAFMVQALFVDIWDVYPTNALFWSLAALISARTVPEI